MQTRNTDSLGESPLLSISNLTTEFKVRGSWHAAVRNVSLDVHSNETLAIVGESGCGKSMTAMSIMQLLPEHGCRIRQGEIRFSGRDMLSLQERELQTLRGNRLAMIFQEPMTALNPVLPIGLQVAEPLMFHRMMSEREARKEAVSLLEQVGIAAAARRLDDYPHEFSGGMRQRVMIAMALACNPDILIADEPTTALDVTIQAQVLNLLAQLKADRGMGMILITHSLGVVAAVADRVAVMYAGEVVETAPVAEIFSHPAHPYTEALIRSIPRSDRDIAAIKPIGGAVPSIDQMPAGCRFADRCPISESRCHLESPPITSVQGSSTHLARCWLRADAAVDSE
ncbi:ABC transporter ATP-binding protein [Granulosicoccus sp. 3-233]|uniref:ABC transporter ATP-binding protein n=1 Tax=Granulosicoccus sp. 3-233 TaxID=3417969 RepID=UPI003D33A7F3